jgi:uncharacterized cupredoxin-like copper-binding protein
VSLRIRFIAAGLAVGTLACAAKDKASDSASIAPAGAPKDPTPAVVTVHTKDFSFDAPAEITAGMTTFKLVNDGPNLHHMLIVRLDSGKTVADVEASLKKQGPPPGWMVMSGGPNAPDPGHESNTTVNLTEGQYALLCIVDIPGGVPHAAKGMIKALTVKPATGPAAAAPVADVKVVLNDYNFDFSTPITAGSHTFEVRNAAKQPHEIEILKLAPGKTVKDLSAWMTKMAGPPPASAIGGTLPTSGGTPAYFTADFTPGDYVFICFIPDAKDGKPHAQHGMITTVTVK